MMSVNVQAATAREAARNTSNSQFGEQHVADPGSAAVSSSRPFLAVVDFGDNPVGPCMVDVELMEDTADGPALAGYSDFDAAPVLASMPFGDRVHYATTDPEYLYTLACEQRLIEGFPGVVRVLADSYTANWVDQNPQLKLVGEGWTETYDDDEAIVVRWAGWEQAAAETAAARVDRHIQRLLSEGRYVAVSETPDYTMRVMPCLNRSEAVTIAAVNGYSESAVRDGYTEFWCYDGWNDDEDDFDYGDSGQADGVIRVYEPEEATF